jgi:hypothetical protein
MPPCGGNSPIHGDFDAELSELRGQDLAAAACQIDEPIGAIRLAGVPTRDRGAPRYQISGCPPAAVGELSLFGVDDLHQVADGSEFERGHGRYAGPSASNSQ